MSRSLVSIMRLLLLSLMLNFMVSCSSSPGAKDNYPKPDTPTLTATPENGKVKLSWSAINTAVSYKIYWSTTPQATRDMSDPIAITGSSYEHVDLVNTQTYYYAVSALSEYRESEKSAEVAATPQSPPIAPSNIKAVWNGDVATVTWDPVPNVNSYTVYMLNNKDETRGTAFARGGLDETLSYNFSVTATNIGGESNKSEVGIAAPATIAIASGANHSCAIKPDKSLVCWGANDSGQLGLGNNAQSLPTKVGDQERRRVSTGGRHTCAINIDRELFCWGGNVYGQLGLGGPDLSNKTTPTQIGIDRNWQTVSAGVDHTCAVKTNHTLWCWGSNEYGQSGLSEVKRVNQPQGIYLEQSWSTVAAGDHHTCAIQQNGALQCWGENTFGQLGGGTASSNSALVAADKDLAWTTVAVGGQHTCALKTDTSLWCWGRNQFGQIGIGTSGPEPSLTPQRVGKNQHWTSVQLGKQHSCAMRIDGQLSCWGSNFHYQLSDNNVDTRTAPEEIISGPTWRTASLGDSHTCALADDGTFRCWGNNAARQRGIGSSLSHPTPTSVTSEGDWRYAVAGWYHTCAIKQDDSIWCWGGSNQKTTPVLAGAGKQYGVGWTSVAMAHFRACALRADQTLWCTVMGYGSSPNFNGAQKFGSESDQWKQVVITDTKTCALRIDRTVWCWGATYDGQALALDSTADWVAIALNSQDVFCAIQINGSRWCKQNSSSALVNMDSAANLKSITQDGQCGIKSDDTMKCLSQTGFAAKDTWRKVSSNSGGVCAIRSDQSLWCEGSRVGTDAWDDISVNDNSAAEFNVSGYTYYCGVKIDHTLWCWGEGHYGQLGNADVQQSPTPLLVKNESPWTWDVVSAGGHHTCAIGNNPATNAAGRLHCWGKNNYGQLGVPSTASFTTPQLVDSTSQWLNVASGTYHTCGIKITSGATAGTLWCWGANGYGQLGANPREEKRAVPTRVNEDTDWVLVVAGDYHTCALKSGGTLWCWGFNAYGQIGNNKTENNFTLTQIEPQNLLWKTITAGENHTCAITVANKLYCWGDNYSGQLGAGDTQDRHTPTPIKGDDTIIWSAVTAGSQHTCAIRTGGDLWCWGDHQFGQLAYGNDQNTRRLIPEKSLSFVSHTAAGSKHTCVTFLNQNPYGVYCSGANNSGQLGDGSLLSKSSPVPSNIGSPPSFTVAREITISAGSQHTCAIRENGALQCWGDNSDGQLGTGP